MSVLITTPNLNSEPDDFGSGEQATLVLHLITTVEDGENANIVYTIETGGYTFGSGGTSLTVNKFVAGSGTTESRAPYSLVGPDGGVNLKVSVTPANPPSTGRTRVALRAAIRPLDRGGVRAPVSVAPTRPPALPTSAKRVAKTETKRSGKKSAKTKRKVSRKQTGKRVSTTARRKGSTVNRGASKGAKNKKK